MKLRISSPVWPDDFGKASANTWEQRLNRAVRRRLRVNPAPIEREVSRVRDQGKQTGGEGDIAKARPESQVPAVIPRLRRSSSSDVLDRRRDKSVDDTSQRPSGDNQRIQRGNDQFGTRSTHAVEVAGVVETFDPVQLPTFVGSRNAAELWSRGVVVDNRRRKPSKTAGFEGGRGQRDDRPDRVESPVAGVMDKYDGCGHSVLMLPVKRTGTVRVALRWMPDGGSSGRLDRGRDG